VGAIKGNHSVSYFIDFAYEYLDLRTQVECLTCTVLVFYCLFFVFSFNDN
jgi:hypothetical protein